MPVVVDDAQVRSMMGNPLFRKTFPFLATAYSQQMAGQGGCGGCGNKRRTNSADLGAIRRAIGVMDIEKKAKLKEMLGGEQVIVSFDNGQGRNVRLKF